MRIGPFEITRRKDAQNLITSWPSTTGSSWWPVLGEIFPGAWQRGVVTPVTDALTHPTFWSCVTLIASDIAKGCLDLVEEDSNGITAPIESSAFSPVLRRPNHYQNRIQFIESWIISKLTRGNTYALKARDARGVVTDLYVLDPTRVRPMIGPNGDVFYALQQDVLSEVTEASTVVPAREIIHDRFNCLYHPLCGLSPVYASGQAAIQALTISSNSTKFFQNGSLLAGLLVAPTKISLETQERLEKYWAENYAGPQNAGKIAVIGDNMRFEEPKRASAVDSQLIDQLKWDDEKICATFHVPRYMVGVGPEPTYNNIEALTQAYYSQCLQAHVEALELSLEEGLGVLDAGYEIEYDIDALFRMDSATKMKTATDGVKGGIYTPNEARARFNLGPLKGGDTVYLQQQDYSLEALAKRDAGPDPFGTAAKPAPPAPMPPAPKETITDALSDVDRVELLAVLTKGFEDMVAA